KHALLQLGHPVSDHAGYVDGEAHEIDLSDDAHGGKWHLRDYQRQAIDQSLAGESRAARVSCGAGTAVHRGAPMSGVQTPPLILVTNAVSAKQWKDEILARTPLTEDEVGEYSGSTKEIRPITIATYQVLTTRRKGSYLHLELLDAKDWGLVIYDEEIGRASSRESV